MNIRLPDGRVVVSDTEHACSNAAGEMLREAARMFVQIFVRAAPNACAGAAPAYMIINGHQPVSVPTLSANPR